MLMHDGDGVKCKLESHTTVFTTSSWGSHTAPHTYSSATDEDDDSEDDDEQMNGKKGTVHVGEAR